MEATGSFSSLAEPPRFGGWRVVGEEEALRGTASHGVVSVKEQPREAACEILDEAVRNTA